MCDDDDDDDNNGDNNNYYHYNSAHDNYDYAEMPKIMMIVFII